MRTVAAGEAGEVTDILAAVTPGGGKSLLPVIAAHALLAAGVVDRLCWVVPRDSLRQQAEEAFADPTWGAALGHTVCVRAADNAPDPSRDLQGYVTTYQSIAAAPDLHLRAERWLSCRQRSALDLLTTHPLIVYSKNIARAVGGDSAEQDIRDDRRRHFRRPKENATPSPSNLDILLHIPSIWMVCVWSL